MKLFHKIIGFSALLLSLTACQSDFDMPDMVEPTYEGTPNITIAEIRAMGAGMTQNDTIRFADNLVLKAVVSANDKSGNIFKKIYLQDATGNIEMEVDQSNIYTDYPVGQELFLDLKGLSLSVYGGELQLGHPDAYNFRCPYVVFTAQAHKNGYPDVKKINLKEVSRISELGNADAFALVKFKNVRFKNGGKNKFAPKGENYTTEYLLDSKGDSIAVRTSNYAEFAAETLPADYGNVTAILGRYNDSWQLTIRTLDDLEFEHGDEPVVTGIQFKKATSITSGKKYLIAAKVDGVSKVAQAIAANRTYGYIYADDANAQSDVITMDDESHAYTISASGSGYTLKDAYGRYLYMTGTYNNFNLTEDASQEGAIWTITKNADGTFKLLNQTMGKYIQWSTQYTSYGSYPDENGIMPELFEEVGGGGGGVIPPAATKTWKAVSNVTSGKKYLIVTDGKAAKIITSNYGYLKVEDVTVTNNEISLDDETNSFTIASTAGGYTIQQSDGRYLYMTGTYNSFNVNAAPTEGNVWTITPDNGGTFKIMNAAMSKFIQFDSQYGSYGSYADERGTLPKLFELSE